MNRLYYIKSLYWIFRNNGKKGDPRVGVGFMRQTSPPWKLGKGLHLRIGRYSFQIGVAKSTGITEEDAGLLMSVGGRYMDARPGDIGEW